MQDYVGTKAVALTLDVKESWVRSMVAKKVVLDMRTRRTKGSPLFSRSEK